MADNQTEQVGNEMEQTVTESEFSEMDANDGMEVTDAVGEEDGEENVDDVGNEQCLEETEDLNTEEDVEMILKEDDDITEEAVTEDQNTPVDSGEGERKDDKGTTKTEDVEGVGADVDIPIDEFEVVDEAHVDISGKPENKASKEKPTKERKKPGPKALVVYPILLSDLGHPKLKDFLEMSKSAVTKFVGERNSNKKGIIYARFNTTEILEKASEKVKGLILSGNRKPMVKFGNQRALLFREMEEIRKLEKASFTEDAEPVSVFVNNIPTNTCETMLQFLFPTAKSIQLPLNSQGNTHGYGILEYSSRREARTVIQRNKHYKARIGQKILKLHLVGDEDHRDSSQTSAEQDKPAGKNKGQAEEKQGSGQKQNQSLPQSAKPGPADQQNEGQPLKQEGNAKNRNRKRQRNDSVVEDEKKPRIDDKEGKPVDSNAKKHQPKAKVETASATDSKDEVEGNANTTSQPPKEKATGKQQPSVDKKTEQPSQSTDNGGIPQSKNKNKNRKRKEKKKLLNQGQSNVVNPNPGPEPRWNQQSQGQPNAATPNIGQMSKKKQRQMLRNQNRQMLQNQPMNRGPFPQQAGLGGMTTSQLQALGLNNVQPGLLQGLKSFITASMGGDMGFDGRNSGRGNSVPNFGQTSPRSFSFSPVQQRDQPVSNAKARRRERARANRAEREFSGRNTGYGKTNQNQKSYSTLPSFMTSGQQSVNFNNTMVSPNRTYSDSRGNDFGMTGRSGGYDHTSPNPSTYSLYANDNTAPMDGDPYGNNQYVGPTGGYGGLSGGMDQGRQGTSAFSTQPAYSSAMGYGQQDYSANNNGMGTNPYSDSRALEVSGRSGGYDESSYSTPSYSTIPENYTSYGQQSEVPQNRLYSDNRGAGYDQTNVNTLSYSTIPAYVL